MGWDAQRRHLMQLSDSRPFHQRRNQAVWRGRSDGGPRDLWRCATRICLGLNVLALHLDTYMRAETDFMHRATRPSGARLQKTQMPCHVMPCQRWLAMEYWP